MRLQCQTWMVFISLVISFVVCTGGVGWAQTSIDWTQPFELAANIGNINGKPWANVDRVSGKAKANIKYVAGAGVAAAAASYCSAAWNTSTGKDILCENFESSGLASWSTVGTPTGTWEMAAPLAALADCTDEGSQSLHVSVTGTNEYERSIDLGANKADNYVQFWIYIHTAASTTNHETTLLRVSDQSNFSSYTFRLRILKAATAGKSTLRYGYWSEDATAIVEVTTAELSLDTWYRVVLKYVNGENGSIAIDGGAATEGATHAGGRSARYVRMGPYYRDSFALEYNIDNLGWNSTAVADCD